MEDQADLDLLDHLVQQAIKDHQDHMVLQVDQAHRVLLGLLDPKETQVQLGLLVKRVRMARQVVKALKVILGKRANSVPPDSQDLPEIQDRQECMGNRVIVDQ